MRGCSGIGMMRRADQHQVHAFDERRAVMLEEIEQLGAALVLVDAADVDREPIAHVELLAEPRRRSIARGISEPMPTTTPGTVWLFDTAWISARSSNELYMSARTPRNIGAKMPSPSAPSRSAVGTRIAFAGTARHAVIRVVIAEAEEDEEVEVGFVRL